jgi:maltooligosyltrehalose trehalohydrolase
VKPLAPVPELGASLDGDTARLRVWAPEHARVELIVYRADRSILSTHPMRRERGGYFSTTTPLPGGPRRLLYAFRIDERGPFPDPCSGSQPFGVHGPSELIDFDHEIVWTDAGFRGRTLAELVLYEIHVGAATPEGTFEALIPRLDGLVDLGVTAIELMPVASFPGRWNWGYDGVSLRAPAAVYGGPRGLMRLVDAAHARGLAVILDVVYNHLGPDGNYLRAFSSRYFTSRRITPWGEAIDVDGPGAEPVRELLLGSAATWIDRYHVDGLRLDATHAIEDTRPVHVLRELGERARAAGGARGALIIAEDERNEAALVRPIEASGLGLDAVWADDLHYQLGLAFAGDLGVFAADFTGSTQEIASTLERGWSYEGQVSPRLGRPRGTSAAGVAPPQIVTFVQNHDQIGNRPRGDRLGARVSPAAFRALSALLLLAPTTPLIFMGQEWNATAPFFYFTDHHGELGRLVTEGRRRELGASGLPGAMEAPDPQDEATFLRSRLDWAERERPEHAVVLALYRELLRLRAAHPALRERARGSFAARALGDDALVLDRRGGGRCLTVLVNVRGRLTHGVGRRHRVVLSTEDPRFGGRAAASLRHGIAHLDGPAVLVLEDHPLRR